MNVYRVSREEWQKISEVAHLAVFEEQRNVDIDRYNYAVVAADEKRIYAYTTVIEMDNDTAYMQHGGALPDTQKTVSVKRVYKLMVDWLKQNYKRISTRIQNTNVAMLKLAMSEGLRVDGISCYGRDVFLSLSWGFESE